MPDIPPRNFVHFMWWWRNRWELSNIIIKSLRFKLQCTAYQAIFSRAQPFKSCPSWNAYQNVDFLASPWLQTPGEARTHEEAVSSPGIFLPVITIWFPSCKWDILISWFAKCRSWVDLLCQFRLVRAEKEIEKLLMIIPAIVSPMTYQYRFVQVRTEIWRESYFSPGSGFRVVNWRRQTGLTRRLRRQ